MNTKKANYQIVEINNGWFHVLGPKGQKTRIVIVPEGKAWYVYVRGQQQAIKDSWEEAENFAASLLLV